jgi:uncharacterized membrane-anchored protein YitT (DUF2179 family)
MTCESRILQTQCVLLLTVYRIFHFPQPDYLIERKFWYVITNIPLIPTSWLKISCECMLLLTVHSVPFPIHRMFCNRVDEMIIANPLPIIRFLFFDFMIRPFQLPRVLLHMYLSYSNLWLKFYYPDNAFTPSVFLYSNPCRTIQTRYF